MSPWFVAMLVFPFYNYREKQVIVYVCPPMDHNWGHLQTVEQVAAELAAAEARLRFQAGHKDEYPEFSVDEFLTNWEEAKQKAGEHGWEGDFRVEPRVFWLPNQTGFDYAFAFKQDNNGTTFIVTPVRLHWVEKYTD